jgi:hypothetical protein
LPKSSSGTPLAARRSFDDDCSISARNTAR